MVRVHYTIADRKLSERGKVVGKRPVDALWGRIERIIHSQVGDMRESWKLVLPFQLYKSRRPAGIDFAEGWECQIFIDLTVRLRKQSSYAFQIGALFAEPEEVKDCRDAVGGVHLNFGERVCWRVVKNTNYAREAGDINGGWGMDAR